MVVCEGEIFLFEMMQHPVCISDVSFYKYVCFFSENVSYCVDDIRVFIVFGIGMLQTA